MPAMSWPASARELRAAGYRGGNWALCSGPTCSKRILWAVTPNAKRMPLEELGMFVGDDRTFEPHWAKCPDAGSFRHK